MLKFADVDVYYGAHHVLRGVDYEVFDKEIVCLLGGNASGKSTTMKAILGVVRPTNGAIHFLGRRIDQLETSDIIRAGVAPVPEARRIFPLMSVHENLEMGAYVRRDKAEIAEGYDRVYEMFPRLAERKTQIAGTMSGGEQQMLAVGRALMARPTLLIMDEPSMGLSPLLVEKSFETIQSINQQGVTIFLVEQNAAMALSIAHRGYVIQTGRIILSDTATNLINNELVAEAYLGTESRHVGEER